MYTTLLYLLKKGLADKALDRMGERGDGSEDERRDKVTQQCAEAAGGNNHHKQQKSPMPTHFLRAFIAITTA